MPQDARSFREVSGSVSDITAVTAVPPVSSVLSKGGSFYVLQLSPFNDFIRNVNEFKLWLRL
jgi:hypothetical protein